eukprot:6209426-Pleurochrysis_carterae.AAC.2
MKVGNEQLQGLRQVREREKRSEKKERNWALRRKFGKMRAKIGSGKVEGRQRSGSSALSGRASRRPHRARLGAGAVCERLSRHGALTQEQRQADNLPLLQRGGGGRKQGRRVGGMRIDRSVETASEVELEER